MDFPMGHPKGHSQVHGKPTRVNVCPRTSAGEMGSISMASSPYRSADEPGSDHVYVLCTVK